MLNGFVNIVWPHKNWHDSSSGHWCTYDHKHKEKYKIYTGAQARTHTQIHVSAYAPIFPNTFEWKDIRQSYFFDLVCSSQAAEEHGENKCYQRIEFMWW